MPCLLLLTIIPIFLIKWFSCIYICIYCVLFSMYIITYSYHSYLERTFPNPHAPSQTPPPPLNKERRKKNSRANRTMYIGFYANVHTICGRTLIFCCACPQRGWLNSLIRTPPPLPPPPRFRWFQKSINIIKNKVEGVRVRLKVVLF